MEFQKFYKEFYGIYKPIIEFEQNCLPLCAAESEISDFVRKPLSSFVQEKYILGSILGHSKNNFIGSEKLFKIYTLLTDLCKELFSCKYADGRTLTGVNTITTLLMSLFEIGDTIYISSPKYGGHSSMPKICKRLGINFLEMPYDLEKMDFCYGEINNNLRKHSIKGILICLSDMIFQPDLSQLDLSTDVILIYDATQVLGLIAADKVTNYFKFFSDECSFVLAGSTHKTLPGPTNGLIMTNSQNIIRNLDLKINPDYLRSIQMHQVLSLIFCLEEFSIFGKEYMDAVVKNSNVLAGYLNNKGFEVIERNGVFSDTHQIFIHMPFELTHAFYLDCQLYNITLNERYSYIYNSSGIRLGVQQISRYGWGNNELASVSEIFKLIYEDCILGNHIHYSKISNMIKELANHKKLKYTLSSNDVLRFSNLF